MADPKTMSELAGLGFRLPGHSGYDAVQAEVEAIGLPPSDPPEPGSSRLPKSTGIARRYFRLGFATVLDLLLNAKDDRTRLAAAVFVLERGYGNASQVRSAQPARPFAHLTDEELRTRLGERIASMTTDELARFGLTRTAQHR